MPEKITFAEAEERLAESLPTYESRPQQQALARKIEEALEQNRHLLAEAGCGTGKSFGYSIPAIAHAAEGRNNGSKVVISTATKALQSQLVEGDLPFLQEHLGVDFEFALLKGRSNYLCLAKMNEPEAEEVSRAIREEVGDDALDNPDSGYDGDVERLRLPLTVIDRGNVTISADECPGKRECPFGSVCFAEKAKVKAHEADVVVSNHALYFTDMVIREKTSGVVQMLPDHDVVVFDEAHEIEEIAGNVLGSKITEAGVRHLLSMARNFAGEYNINIEGEISEVSAGISGIWQNLVEGRFKSHHLTQSGPAFMSTYQGLVAIYDKINEAWIGEDRADERRRQSMARRVGNFVERFQVIIGDPFEETVRWVEKETVRTKSGPVDRLTLNFAPINVGNVLRSRIWEFTDPNSGKRGPTAILTSATMSVAGKFDYLAGRLGLTEFDSIDVGTPFDFSKQAGLYVPTGIPEPSGQTRLAWGNIARQQMLSLVQRSEGRALLLFSSIKEMQAAYDALSASLPYTCLYQGMPGKSRNDLAAEFKADTHSVLFATKSFFTGVDFQGETCSLVVMDKLPFAVPTDALNEARVEAVAKEHGGNGYKAFMAYSVPLMSLTLKQGFGRLIRHREDSGVVAILDPRLNTKAYGKTILASLPNASRLASLAEVGSFYEAA